MAGQVLQVPAALAAAGSIASQVVGMGLGVQEGFSWKGVALSALSGGVGAGLGDWANLGTTAGTWPNAMVRAAVGNALTQTSAVVLGLQPKFDWRGVAASAVGAGVGHAVGDALGLRADTTGQNPGVQTFTQLAKRLATGLLAGTAAAVARGGKVAIQQLATDAFGQALADGFMDGLREPVRAVGGGGGGGGGASVSSRSGGSSVSAMASGWGDRNGSDVQSDGFVPAMAYDYENGSDLQSDASQPSVYALSGGGDGLGLRASGGEGLRFGGLRARGVPEISFSSQQEARILNGQTVSDIDPYTGSMEQTADASAAIRRHTEALRQGWNREGWSVLQGERPIVYDLASSTRTFLGAMTGFDAMGAAQSSFAQGNYVNGSLQTLQAFGEAGMTVFGFGAGGAANGLRAGGMTASEMAAVRATYVESKINPSAAMAPGVEFATVNGKKVFPQTYSQLYHGTDNTTLGLPSSMSADEVAQKLYREGLPVRGTNIDLIEHTINNAPDRAFRGTTTAPLSQEKNAGASYWAMERSDQPIVLEIKNVPGYDVNAALDGRVRTYRGWEGNPRFGEQEIAVPGAISPGNISRIGVPIVKPNGQPGIDWLPRKQ